MFHSWWRHVPWIWKAFHSHCIIQFEAKHTKLYKQYFFVSHMHVFFSFCNECKYRQYKKQNYSFFLHNKNCLNFMVRTGSGIFKPYRRKLRYCVIDLNIYAFANVRSPTEPFKSWFNIHSVFFHSINRVFFVNKNIPVVDWSCSVSWISCERETGTWFSTFCGTDFNVDLYNLYMQLLLWFSLKDHCN